MLVKVSFSDFHRSISKSLMLFVLSQTFGKLIGSNLITIIGLLFHIDQINNISFFSITVCMFILSAIFIMFYSDIRIKAISRISSYKSLNGNPNNG